MKKPTMKTAKVILLVTSILFMSLARAQNKDSTNNNKLNCFIDCSNCDVNYYKENLKFINYARETQDADVYILITNQTTGSGGTEYSFSFNGTNKFKGLNDTLKLCFSKDNTADEIRADQLKIIKMGLMRYVARTASCKNFLIENNVTTFLNDSNIIDKWKSWVFYINLSGIMTGQESYQTTSLGASITANRITNSWKIMNDYTAINNESKYKLDETNTITNKRTSNTISNLITKSMGEHWSIGEKSKFMTSSFDNLKSYFEFSPAIEYDLFKYSESTYKQLRFLYSIGASYNKYIDTTIYNKIEETLYLQKLNILLDLNQQWGSISFSALGSVFLHDFTKNKISLSCNSYIRLFKGLSFNVNGNLSFIRNQLSLPKSDATQEQILLQQRAIATNYSFSIIGGFSYSFGSTNNNIVNPRFSE